MKEDIYGLAARGGKERKGTLRRIELGPTWPRSLPRRRWIGKKRNVCHEIRRFRAEVAEFFLNKKKQIKSNLFLKLKSQGFKKEN